MHPIRHQRWRRAVHAYVDGQLPVRLRAAVGRHLEDCPDCSGEARVLQLVKRSLRRVGGGSAGMLAGEPARGEGGRAGE